MLLSSSNVCQQPPAITLMLDGRGAPQFQPIELKLPNITATEIQLKTDDSAASRRRSIPPEFTTEISDKEIEEGESVELLLYVTGTPDPDVVWYKGDQPITLYPHRRFHATRDGELCGLEIKEARCSDQGEYTCKAYNGAGEVIKSCKLTVHQVTPSSPPVFTRQLKDVHVVEGGCTRFGVRFTGMPDPVLSWYKDGKPVQPDNRYDIVHDEDSSALILKYGKPTDAGTYTCVAENDVGKAETSAKLYMLELQAPPKFVQPLKDLETSRGESARLECRVSGKPDPEIVWLKGSKRIQNDGRHSTAIEQGNLCILSITGTDFQDEDAYVCTATNSTGKATTSAQLVVKGEGHPPEFTKELADVEIPDGSPVRFEVRVQGCPIPEVEWFKDQKALKPGVRFEVQTEGNSFTFIITNCREDDGGKYTCKAKNKFGDATCEATLHIAEDTVPPRFTKKLHDLTAGVGSTSEFSVKFIGTPEPKITWFLDNEEIEPEEHGVDIETELGSSSLLLEDVDVSDVGNYKCVATNIAGKATTAAQLKVVTEEVMSESGALAPVVQVVPPPLDPIGKPPAFVKRLLDLQVTEGNSVSLEVIISGEPQPSVKWLFDDEPVVEDRHVQVTENREVHALMIDGATLDDEGEYKCVASNEHGVVECSAELLVDEVVSQPDFVKELADVSVTEGADAVFKVEVQGHPEPEVSWFLNNVLVEPGGRLKRAEDDELHWLTVHQAKPEDSGEIRCQAKNEAGEVQSVATLSVDVTEKPAKVIKKPCFTRKPQGTRIVEGESQQFRVEVEGFPAPEIKWFDEDGELVPSKGHVRCDSDGTLHVDCAELDDEGQYTCIALNMAGETSASIELLVDELAPKDVASLEPKQEVFPEEISVFEESLAESAPNLEGVSPYMTESGTSKLPVEEKIEALNFIETLRDREEDEHSEVRLEVLVSGSDPEVEWYKNGECVPEVTQRGELAHDKDRGSFTYILYDATLEDQGVYRCEATNSRNQISCEGRLTVLQERIPPRFRQHLEEKEVIEGGDVDMEVEVTGNPKPSVKWFKNGEPIKTSALVKTDTDGFLFSLSISRIKVEDQGEYTCVAENSVGESSCSAELRVREEMRAPVFIITPDDLQITEGTSARFKTRFSGLPQPEIEWFKDGKPVEDSYHFKLAFNENNSVLTILDIKLTDEGEYRCTASNKAGTVSCTAQLSVEESVAAPEFVRRLSNVELIEGGLGRFDVRVAGTPEPEVRWYKDDLELKDSVHYEIHPDDNMHSLLIRQCLLSDTGLYCCVASNDGGEVTCTAQLKVLEQLVPPCFMEAPPLPTEGEEGEDITLGAIATGKPCPQAEWFKDDEPLVNGRHFCMRSEGDKYTLTIMGARPEDSGTYKCVLENLGGTSFRSFTVIIRGKTNLHGKHS